jgi:hypothetical protein
MLSYGMSKAIPAQMPFPSLTTLLTPLASFPLQRLLWSSIGASRGYEVFAGCTELLAGILLIFPRTATLGALVSLATMTQVFMLNMTYDVAVKLLSFHLILLALFLLAPELQRLADFFLRNRPVARSSQPPLFLSRRASRIALAAQIFFGVWLLGMNAWSAWANFNTWGSGHPKASLYGIWNVEEFSIDGQLLQPLVTDHVRWRLAIFDFADRLSYQRMGGSFGGYDALIDDHGKTITLTKGGAKNWKANLTFQRMGQDQLILDGNIDGHKIHMRTKRVELSKSALVKNGFHWVQ